MKRIFFYYRLALYTFALAFFTLVHCNAAAQPQSELPKTLQTLEFVIESASTAVRASFTLNSKLPEEEQWGYMAAVSRFHESSQEAARQIAAAKARQTPTNLYSLRISLGELYVNLKALALWTYLRGVRGGSNVDETQTSALSDLNAATSDLHSRISTYDLEVSAILKK